jgi:nucleoid-associated protein YgaU
MTDSKLAKAQIINVDKGNRAIDCMFNPKEYSFSKQNSWTRNRTPNSNVPPLQFGGGQPATLQLQLFFDTYTAASPGSDPPDVRKKYTDEIWELMMVDESLKDSKSKKGRPPKVRFQWGNAWSFNAVITNIKQNFTLFLYNGTPVRATLDVTFQQIEDQKLFPRQNPTSGGVGGERLWTINPGDTLAWIAYKEYGDPNQWRAIADANQLLEVRRLTPGRVLVIPNV